MNKRIDYTGMVFKNFKVINSAPAKITINPDGTKRTNNMWNCVCNCGDVFKRAAKNMNRDQLCKKCAMKAFFSKIHIPHKHSEDNRRLRIIWNGMKNRCYNIKHVSFKYYGSNGIIICDQWLNGFDEFMGWAIENGYLPGLTIDRIKGAGNYEPSNCRWITKKQQQANRRDNRRFDYKGTMLTAHEISAITSKRYSYEYNKHMRKLHKNGR